MFLRRGSRKRAEQTPEPAETGELGGQVSRGLRWSLVNSAAGRAGSFIVGVALARILAPHDYGVYAVALIMMQLVLSLNDLGTSPAAIRCEAEELPRVTSTGATLTALMSVVLFAVMFAATPLFTSLVHTPQATGVVRLMCVGVLIDGAFAVPSALLTRSLRQDRRLISDLTVFAVSTALTLSLAIGGFGPWSLAWGQLGGNLAGGLVVLAVTRPRLRFGWDRQCARSQLAIGLPFTGATVLQIVILNVDSVVVGRLLGTTALGLYVLAFNLSSWPVTILAVTVRRVSVAALARLRDDADHLRAQFAKAVVLLFAVTAPVCGLLALLARPLISTVYGTKWLPAAAPLEFLAGLGAARVLVELFSDYLLVLGRARRILLLQAVWAALLIPALTVGARMDGLRGVALGHMVVAAVIVLPSYLLAVHFTGVRTGLIAAWATIPAAATAAALTAASFAMLLSSRPPLELVEGGSMALLIYGAAMYLGRPWRLERAASAPLEHLAAGAGEARAP